jgi:hypothetical protein
MNMFSKGFLAVFLLVAVFGTERLQTRGACRKGREKG